MQKLVKLYFSKISLEVWHEGDRFKITEYLNFIALFSGQ